MGHVTSYGFDKNGFLISVTDANGKVSTIVYKAARQKLADVDQLGNYTTYTFAGDGLRRTSQEAGASLTAVVWDGDDYLQERT